MTDNEFSESLEENAGFGSRLFFCWVYPLFKHDKKSRKVIYNCNKKEKAHRLGNEIEKVWNDEFEKQKTKPSLTRVLRLTFIKTYVFVTLMLIQRFLPMLQPILLTQYISYHEGNSKELWIKSGWASGSCMIILSFLTALVNHHCNLYYRRVGMRCRVATCSLLYKKLLKLNKASVERVSFGQLVNLFSNDVLRFDWAATYYYYIWIIPFQTVIALCFIYYSAGLTLLTASMVGLLGIIAPIVMVQFFFKFYLTKYRKLIAAKTDYRINLISEITNSIQVIKLHTWEPVFENLVTAARKAEIQVMRKSSYIKGIFLSFMVFTERLTTCVTTVTYVLLGNKVTAEIVFGLAQLFNILQVNICWLLQAALFTLAEAEISIRRIEKFLLLDERKTMSRINQELDIPKNNSIGLIKLEHVNAGWLYSNEDLLKDLNVEIQPGMLCCVTGSLNAGKKSFIQLLLKELIQHCGNFDVVGKKSYCSQIPWFFYSSIRENILFGADYDKERYKRIIEVSGLQEIFNLPEKDKTLINNHGTPLSGIQKTLMNLARSVYHKADIYLFDDIFLTLDAKLSNHLFDNCICNFLNSKTRVLVTKRREFLEKADLIVILNNGNLQKVGKFSDVQKELQDLNLLHYENVNKTMENVESNGNEHIELLEHNLNSDEKNDSETQQLIEGKKSPSVKYWRSYRAAGSLTLQIVVAVLLVVAQASCNFSDWWLAYWITQESFETDDTDDANFIADIDGLDSDRNTSAQLITNEPYTFPQEQVYISIYVLAVFCSVVLLITRSYLFCKECLNIARNLHKKVFGTVIQSAMIFFENYQLGELLNKFSKDMGAVDELLPYTMIDASQVVLVMIGALVMVGVVTPMMLLLELLLVVIFFGLMKIYLGRAQDLKRLEGELKTPTFSHVMASFEGLTTIRAMSQQEMVMKQLDNLQDRHTGVWFSFLAVNEAFGFLLSVISNLFLMIVVYQFLLFDGLTTEVSYVALVVSQTLILTGMLQRGALQVAKVERNMISVERILQNNQLHDTEFVKSSIKPDWPNSGTINFKNVSMSSRSIPLLKNISFKIHAGEKVSIVGPKGAGKSAIRFALLRLWDFEGLIEIDGVDIKTISLKDLRSNMSITERQPTLFTQSLRFNLDPLGKSDDEALRKVLEYVGLAQAGVEDLEETFAEGGLRLTFGQQQLICLARTLLQKNKILIMDGTISSEDLATAALIQKTIREQFNDCTVLLITNNLDTLVGSDKILEMNAGVMQEFAHPYELLQNSDSYFCTMARETGRYNELLEKSKQKYQLQKQSHVLV